MKLLFLLGGFAVGGGNYVVIQHASHAQSCGHDVTLLALNRYSQESLSWHPALARMRLLHISAAEHISGEKFDLVVATYWKTALELPRFDSRQYAYFVQSIESRFFGPNQHDLRRLVDRTYALGLPGVTEATWIRDYLAMHYGQSYFIARNGARKDFYSAFGPTHASSKSGALRVLVEGPFNSPLKNTSRSIVLSRRGGASETWLLSQSAVGWFPGVKRVFSRVPVDQVAPIYRSCDVILKLSFVEGMFGPPLEMFHCGGTAIVYDVSGHDEYIVDGHNALVASMGDEAAVLAHLRRLKEDRVLLRNLKQGALETASEWPDWAVSSTLFVQHLESLCDMPGVSRDQLRSEIGALRQEFAHVLSNPASAATEAGSVRRTLLSPWRYLKSKVRPAAQLVEYLAEGYQTRFDPSYALTPAEESPVKRGPASEPVS